MTRRTVGFYDNWVRLLTVMLSGPASIRELEAKAGIHYETLRPLINALHDGGVVYISNWKIDSMGRASIACYQLGFGLDAPKRKPKTPSERTMKYKNKTLARKEKPLVGMSKTLVANNAIDMALRGWGAAA